MMSKKHAIIVEGNLFIAAATKASQILDKKKHVRHINTYMYTLIQPALGSTEDDERKKKREGKCVLFLETFLCSMEEGNKQREKIIFNSIFYSFFPLASVPAKISDLFQTFVFSRKN